MLNEKIKELEEKIKNMEKDLSASKNTIERAELESKINSCRKQIVELRSKSSVKVKSIPDYPVMADKSEPVTDNIITTKNSVKVIL